MIRRTLFLFGVLLLAISAVAGTWTPNNFLYMPSIGARGEGEKKTFDTGLDRVDARLGKEIWVGDPGYGTTLQEAITAIGGNQRILRIPPGTWSINANLTIPTNVNLQIERGAILNVSDTKSLTINGSIEAGPYQTFSWSGSGAIVLGSAVSQVYAEWFGADSSGTAFSTDAFNKALSGSNRSIVLVPGATYKVAGVNLASVSNINITGGGGAKIKLSGGAGYNAIQIGNSCSKITISSVVFEGDGLFDGPQNKGYGIYASGTGITDLVVEKCFFTNFGNGGIKLSGTGIGRVRISDNYLAGNIDSANGSADIALYVSGVEDAIISQNQCLSANDIGIFLTPQTSGTEKIIVTGNISKNHRRHGIDVYAQDTATESNRIIISNNYTENNGWCGIYLNASGENHGSIVVNSNISFKDSTTVYPGSGPLYSAIQVSNTTTNAKPVIVSNNLVESPQSGNSGIIVQASGNVLVSNNYIVNSTGYGIRNSTSIDKVTYVGNVLENCSSTSICVGPCGDYITIADNRITCNGLSGIEIYAEVKPGKYTKIIGNTIVNTGAAGASAGISFRTGTPNLFDISGNTISGFDKNLYVWNSGQAYGKVQNNIITNGASYGIYNYAREIVYSGNVYYNNATDFSNVEWHSPVNVSHSYQRNDGVWSESGIKRFYSSAVPTSKVWGVGDQILKTDAAPGGTPGWICTTAGGAYSAIRADSTAYSVGTWIKWSSGSTIWECTTAGTSSGSPPDISGKVVGDTVTDGTVVWTCRSLSTAVFKALANLSS